MNPPFKRRRHRRMVRLYVRLAAAMTNLKRECDKAGVRPEVAVEAACAGGRHLACQVPYLADIAAGSDGWD